MLTLKTQELEEIFTTTSNNKRLRQDLFEQSLSDQQHTHKCYWASEEDIISLPHVIIPSDNNLNSFYADVATFYPEYSPISAYVHIQKNQFINYDLSTTKKTKRIKPQPQPPKNTSLTIGLIIGEALVNALSSTNQPNGAIGYPACRKTLSFAISRSKFLHPEVQPEEVTNRWTLSQQLSGTEVNNHLLKEITDCNEVIRLTELKLAYFGPEYLFLFSKYLSGAISLNDYTAQLSSFYIGLDSHINSLNGPFDGRMQTFDQIKNIIANSSKSDSEKSLSLGFFCNSILPGSLTHATVLTRLTGDFPMALFWYGVFASLSKEFKWRSIAQGTGLKLIRDIQKPFSLDQRPSCDIAIEEFEVLSRASLKATAIKPLLKRALNISLLPGVEIILDIASEDKPNEDTRDMSTRIFNKNQKAKSLLIEALAVLDDESIHTARRTSHYATSDKRTIKKP